MANYKEPRVNLTNAQLSKFKYAAINRTGTILKTTNKSFRDKEFPPELFLTTRLNKKCLC